LTATPTSTITVNAGQVGTFTPNTLTNHWISSNVPVVVTATQTGWDTSILSPMSKYVYQRYPASLNTTNNTTPTNSNSYVTYDSNYNVMNMNVGDGAGGDSAQGLGLQYLSDRYSWGNVLSDYTIVFPYNATVTAEYWNGTNWIIWDTHNITNGSITNPPRVARDGTAGPGVESTNITGLTNNMASGATLWRWVGTAPFYLCINDIADAEFSVLGWLNSTISSPRSGNMINDISGNSNNLIIYGGAEFTSNLTLNLSDNNTNQYLMNANFPNPTQQVTYSIWFKSRFFNPVQTPFTYSVGGNNEMLFFISNSTTITPHCKGSAANYTVENMTNKWINFVWTSDRVTGDDVYYINGEVVGTRNYGLGSLITTGGYLIIGEEADLPGGGFDANQDLDGEFSNMCVYNKIFTASEIKQSFNALRGRYGI
jgi:hypothetical protein